MTARHASPLHSSRELTTPMAEKVSIRTSTIHGRGVFACRDFKKGEPIHVWDTTHVVSLQEYERLPKTEQAYVDRREDGSLIMMQPPEKYVNHSCEPNTSAIEGRDVALRDIKKGEELTTDYASHAPPGWSMRCCCGSKRCRKVITAGPKN